MRPPFIVIEGLDGTGKSTLARALARTLGAELLRTPPDDLAPVRAVVDRALLPSAVGTQLFYASTVALASDRARALLASGRGVVIDRYWSSTVAYAACRDAAVDLGPVAAALLPADVAFFLDADEAARRERLTRRGATDADRDSLARHAALRAAYERALAGPWNGRVVRIDTTARGADECLATALAALAALRAREAA